MQVDFIGLQSWFIKRCNTTQPRHPHLPLTYFLLLLSNVSEQEPFWHNERGRTPGGWRWHMTNWWHVLLLKIALNGIVITLWDSFHWDMLELSCFSHLLSMIQASNMLQGSPKSCPVSCILTRPGWPATSVRLQWKYPEWLLEMSSFGLVLGDAMGNVTNVVLQGKMESYTEHIISEWFYEKVFLARIVEFYCYCALNELLTIIEHFLDRKQHYHKCLALAWNSFTCTEERRKFSTERQCLAVLTLLDYKVTLKSFFSILSFSVRIFNVALVSGPSHLHHHFIVKISGVHINF